MSASPGVARPRVLAIGGLDSAGLAGITLDARVLAACGVHPMTVASTLTVQTIDRFVASGPVDEEIFRLSLQTVLREHPPSAVKLGMLAKGPMIEEVAGFARDRGRTPWILDPILATSSKTRVLDAQAVQALLRLLVPHVDVLTPNVPEARLLTGRPIATDRDVREAAEALVGLGARAVVIKGGHREGGADDHVFDGRRHTVIAGERVDGPEVRGTGCIYASALAAYLARGFELIDAARAAKDLMNTVLRSAVPWEGTRKAAAVIPGDGTDPT